MMHSGPSLALWEWAVLICMEKTVQSPPLISLVCSPLLYKNLCLHWDMEMGYVTWIPHLWGDGICGTSPPSSRWLTPKNKPLSFTSAPASQMLAFIAADNQTCFQLQEYTFKSDFQYFFKLYFIDYAITVVLIFPLSPLPPSTPIPSGISPPLFMSMGHVYKFFGCSISYTVLYIPIAILQLPICTS